MRALWRMAVLGGLLILAAMAAADYAAAQEAVQVDGQPMMLAVDKAPLIFAGPKGQARFKVEIARTEEEKERGLMYRRIFPKDRAMLFIFEPPQIVQMWMANTILPLDMIFADKSGKIIYVYEGAMPFSRNVISSVHPASYVVEVNAGAVAANGIKAGQYMRHPLICGRCEAAAE